MRGNPRRPESQDAMRKTLFAILPILAILAPGLAQGATPSAGNLRIAIDSNPDFSNLSQTAPREQYVVLQAWQLSKLHEIKAASPSTKVLVYKNLSASIRSSNGGFTSTGVSYAEADALHPEWFLKNTAGNRFTFNNYSYLWAMDVGDPGYQQRWAANVVNELNTQGWDGVMLDDTNTTMSYHYDVPQIAKYPSDAAWQSATRSALAYIGPRVQAAGKLAIPNIGTWGENPAVGQDWLQFVSGGMDEMFAKWGTTPGTGYVGVDQWNRQLSSLKYAQQQGKIYLAVSHSANGDSSAARYGYASVLLGGEGKASFALHADYTTENWIPEYDYNLGSALGGESADSTGVHRRVFSNGIVVVNPTESTVTSALNGVYSGSGLNNVSSVALPPHTAAILTGTSTDSGTAPDSGSISTGGRKVKRGKVVVTGSLNVPPSAKLAPGDLRIVLSQHGHTYRQRAARLGPHGHFIGKIVVCNKGRYRISATSTSTGAHAQWPGRIRIKRSQIRCG